MALTLSGQDQAIYDLIFEHPVSHSLEWRGLISVLNRLGNLEEEPNGKLRFSRNGQTLTLHSGGQDVDVEEVLRLRHFLEGSEYTSQTSAGQNNVLVVLDHAGAKIFRGDAVGTKPEHVVPLDPRGFEQQVHNSRADFGSKEGPMRKLFYEAVVQHLKDADRILLIGDGQGSSNEVEHFVKEIEQHHRDVAKRVVGTETANLSHMTDAELVAKSREVFEGGDKGNG